MPHEPVRAILNEAMSLLNRNIHREKSAEVLDRPYAQSDAAYQEDVCQIDDYDIFRPVKRLVPSREEEPGKATARDQNQNESQGSAVTRFCRRFAFACEQKKKLQRNESVSEEDCDPEEHPGVNQSDFEVAAIAPVLVVVLTRRGNAVFQCSDQGSNTVCGRRPRLASNVVSIH
jgi:hypothetical protein